MKNKVMFILTIVLLASFVASCATPTPQVIEKEVVVTKEVPVEVMVTKVVEPDYVTVRMNWTYGGYHAFFFYGKDMGFYKDENIFVEIREGNGSGNVARTVASKDDTFAYVSPEPVFAQISQGAPLKFIYTVDGSGQWGYICRNDRNIKTAKDLEGKIILTSPGSASITIHPVFIERAGLDPTKMQDLTLVDATAIIPTVLSGKADCALGGVTDQAPLMSAQGHEPVVIEMKDYGVGGIGGAVIAHDDLIKGNPDLVARFIRATQKSQKACVDNPDDCIEALLRSFPQKDPVGIKGQFVANLPYWLSPKNTSNCYGWFIEEDWNDAYLQLKNSADSPIKGDLPLSAYLDASFVPPCQ